MADRTNRGYNLHLCDADDCAGGWPRLAACGSIPSSLLGFNYVKSATAPTGGVHFFVDDYQFERLWREPERYTPLLADFECLLTPDFSLYTDMPEPMQRWNVYRSRALGNYWQLLGLNVIPTLQWSDAASLRWCFEGLPTGGTVAVSTVGVRTNTEASLLWLGGMAVAAAALRPSHILHYGAPLAGAAFECPVTYYRNDVTDRMEASHGR
jgi:hypothetical protein